MPSGPTLSHIEGIRVHTFDRPDQAFEDEAPAFDLSAIGHEGRKTRRRGIGILADRFQCWGRSNIRPGRERPCRVLMRLAEQVGQVKPRGIGALALARMPPIWNQA